MVRFKPKKPVVVPPFLRDVIQPVVQAPSAAELLAALDAFDAPHHFEKPEERSLLNWHELLNKFDELLEAYVKAHPVLAAVPKAISGGNPYDTGVTSLLGSSRSLSAIAVNGARSYRLDAARLPQSLEQMIRRRSSERERQSLSQAQGASSPPKEEAPSPPFEPVTHELLLAILKATFRVVRNASHETKNVYNSYDHILTLLVDPDCAISFLSLEILHALLMRSPKNRSYKSLNSPGIVDRLRDVALGPGREKGLGLVDWCSSVEDAAPPKEGHSLLIEFKGSKAKSSAEKDSAPPAPAAAAAQGSSSTPKKQPKSSDAPNISRTVVGDCTRITVRDIRELPGEEEWLVKDFVAKYKIPRNKIFSLLCAYRRAKAFGAGRAERLGIVCQQLISLTTMAQLYPQPKCLAEIIDKESDLIADIVTIAKAEGSHGLSDLPKALRIIAVRCLASLVLERFRINQIVHASGIGTHHGAFVPMLRAEVTSLLAVHRRKDEADSGPVQMDTDASISIPATSVFSGDLDTDDEESSMDVRMVEALLSLVLNTALNGGSSTTAGLVNSGILGVIIPMLLDRVPSHSRAVSQAIRAINEIIQLTHTSVGSQAFRDHDGLNILAERISVEVLGDVPAAQKLTDKQREDEDEKVEQEALKVRGESRELYDELLTQPMSIESVLKHQAPSSSAASRGLLPHSKWTLLRVLHQLFLHSLGVGGSPVRDLVTSSSLPLALRQILARPFYYGGGLFASATTAATTIAHSEPLVTNNLVKAGIAKALIHSVSVGLPPNGDALKVIPNALAALCLASDARQEIVSASPVRPFVLRLARPFYSRAMHGDIPSNIGSALDEMMRHVESLKELGNAALIEFLQTAAAFVELDISGLRESTKQEGSQTGQKPNANSASPNLTRKSSNSSSKAADSTPSDYVLLERMKLAVANCVTCVVGFPQGSAEHQKSIVSGKGLAEILKFRSAPALASAKACARDAHPSSRSSPSPHKVINSFQISLRSFVTRHDTHVLSALFGAIREDAGEVLRLASKLGDAWLPEEGDSNAENAATSTTNGGSKRASGTKDSSLRKRSRTSSAGETAASGKKESPGETKSSSRKLSKNSKDPNVIRSELKDALCVLRVDVVLLSSLSRSGSGSLALAWDSQGGASIISLLASVERLVRYHLACVYTGLSCSTNQETDLCTATVTATKLPSLIPVSPAKVSEGVQEIASQYGLGKVKTAEIATACATLQMLPDKDSDRLEVKGLGWAMETFAYSCQKLYMGLGRGMVYSSRRANRDPMRYGKPIRGVAAAIGTVFVLHLKAAEKLWSRNVTTITEGNVCASWDYVRRILAEIKSTVFCESNRNTQGLILRFFLAAGGANAMFNACRPLSLLKGSRATLSPTIGLNYSVYEANKKRFETFLKSTDLVTVYSSLIVGKIRNARKKTRQGGNAAGKATTDNDTEMKTVDADNAKSMEKDLESMERNVGLFCTNFLYFRRQSTIQKTAGNAWSALCSLLQFFSNCPGLLSSPSSSMPRDLDSPSGLDWPTKAIQRSSQSICIKLLMDVTKEPEEMLSSFKPSGSQTSDVVSIILSILRSPRELAGTVVKSAPSRRARDSDLPRDIRDLHAPPPQEEVNPRDVQALVEMGFPEERAREGLRRTLPGGGVEHAMEWILTHPEDNADAAPNDSDDSSDEDDDQEEGEEAEEVNEHESTPEAAGDDEANVDEEASGDAEMNPLEAEEVLSAMADTIVEAVGAGDTPQVEVEEEEDVPDLVSDDSIRPIVSDREHPSSESTSKTEDSVRLSVDEDAEALLSATMKRDLEDVVFSISSMKFLSKSERNSIAAMLCAAFDLTVSKNGAATKGSERQRMLSAHKGVTEDNYVILKKSLFESLIPVAKAAIEHQVEEGSSSYASFVAVEILSILQKDKCLNADSRLEFASIITSQLKKFLVTPSASSNGLNSVVGIRVSFVWAHYGGSQARNALMASGVSDIAFKTLLEMSGTWDSLGNSGTVDEEATKPIKHLTINEKMELDDGNGDRGTLDSTKNRVLLPNKAQMQALSCFTTCLLILDAFVRFNARDAVVGHAESDSKKKAEKATAMDVDAGAKEENSGEDKEENQTDNPSKMDVDEGPVDIAELTKKVKQRAEEDRAKTTEKAVEELISLVGSKKPLPFSPSELLNSCTKLLSSLSKYEVGDCIIALLQLISSLTADFELSKQFMNEGGVELLTGLPHLETKKTKTTNMKMIRSLVRTILRHVVEDEKSLTEAMVVELRSTLQSSPGRTRQISATRSVISNSSGMISRNLECFTRALASCAMSRSHGNGSDQTLVLADYTPETLEYWMTEAKKRENVVGVVGHLVKLMDTERQGVATFALSLLSEMVQLCPVIAAEFIQAKSPRSLVDGSALDYVVQVLLPVPDQPSTSDMISASFTVLQNKYQEREQLAENARTLVIALLGKTSNAHKPAVKSLAEAARIELEGDETRGGMLKSLSLCISSARKMIVLREMLECDLANFLAKCLDKLDMSVESNSEVTGSVLKALSVIGQASEQSRRSVGDNDFVLIDQPRDQWAVDEPGPGHSPLATGYMVL